MSHLHCTTIQNGSCWPIFYWTIVIQTKVCWGSVFRWLIMLESIVRSGETPTAWHGKRPVGLTQILIDIRPTSNTDTNMFIFSFFKRRNLLNWVYRKDQVEFNFKLLKLNWNHIKILTNLVIICFVWSSGPKRIFWWEV